MDLLYRDDHLVAVRKPAGMFVHDTPLAEPGAQFALQLVRDQLGQRVSTVHRLDRATEGVLLFALDKTTARLLSEGFAAHTIHKEYLAVVRGWMDEEGIIDYPLATDESSTRRPAVTRFRRVATVELPYAVRPHATARYSLVRLFPETGRFHQLRLHLKHVFHPIIGDTTHGDGHHNRAVRQRFGIHRLLLVARVLTLDHPVTGERLRLECPLPRDMRALFEAWGWSPEPFDE